VPLTEKHEIKATCTPDDPIAAHLCAPPSEIVRIYSTSGTTGTPSYAATYPTLGFPQYAGEVGTSDAGADMKARAQKDAEAAVAEPLDLYRAFFLDGKPFIGGGVPSIADIRLAATLEFLRAIDYELPARAEEYMAAMEAALGEAYSEPGRPTCAATSPT
jgi:glutathione S-transferase